MRSARGGVWHAGLFLLNICLAVAEPAGSPQLSGVPSHDHGLGDGRGDDWARELGRMQGRDRANLQRVTGMLDPELWRGLSPSRKRQLLSYTANRFDGDRPLAICWRSGTSPGLVEAFHAVERAARGRKPAKVGAANQIGGHWGSTVSDGSGQNVQGRPVTLRWSLVPDGTGIPSAFSGDTSNPSNFRAWIVGIYGGNAALPPHDPVNAAWFSIFEDMFASYATRTGLRYVYEPNDDGANFPNSSGVAGVRGDLRIGGHEIDAEGDAQGSVLAYNYFPDTGDMVLDTADSFFNSTSNDSIRMRNVLEHEHGHGVGLEHVCPVNQTKLMEPFISVAYLGLQFDDLYSASRNYGDFYERHGLLRDNDSFANAADLGLALGVPFGFQWVCIDDSTDVDYYSFAAVAGSQMTVRVIPSTASYLEGEQNQMTGSCTAGTTFNSGTQHDLTLELIGPAQNVLATASANGAGSLEEIPTFVLPQSGTHYLRVTGGASDSAQMYRLEALVEVPSVALAVQSYGIPLESLLPPNGVVDPGETVRVEVDVRNLGALAATNVQGTLTGPTGFTGFTSNHNFGSLGSGETGTGIFVFGLEGGFGEVLSLDLALTADGGILQTTPLSFTLGKELFALKTGFDQSASLPAGWNSSTANNGTGWSVVTADSFSPAFSIFAGDVGSKGTSVLTSPQVSVSGSSAELMFWHRYNTETNYDGGVLEVSVTGGAWSDILAAGAVFLEGGYVGSLGQGQQNPLPNRSAWTGNSGGFLLTRVDLPAGLLNVPIQFRWIMGHDRTVAGEGWFVDDVMLGSGQFEALGVPELDLSVLDGSTSEFGGNDDAEVRVVTPLPLLAAMPLSLTTGGSADPLADLTGLGSVSLSAGQVEAPIVLAAVSDGEVEGPEILTFDLTPNSAFLIGSNGTAEVSIADTPYGQWAFTNLGAGPLSGPLDDRDGDLFGNLMEYAWGTDGDSSNSYPRPAVFEEGGLLKIQAPLATAPADVVLFAQQSGDLVNWSSTGMQTLAAAFGFPLDGTGQFIRLAVQLTP